MAEVKINMAVAATATVATWNKHLRNTTENNLLDDSGDATTVNIQTTDWDGDHFQISSPNTLGYPDDVWNVGFFAATWDADGVISFTGLPASTLFTVYLSCSGSGADAGDTTYTFVGDTTVGPVAFDPYLNVSNEVTQVISSDVSGNLTINCIGNPSPYGLIQYVRLVGTFDYLTSISNVNSDSPFATDATGVAVNLTAGGNNVTQIKLKLGTIETTQNNLTIVNDTQVTFDAVQGEVPFGVVDCVVTSGGIDYTESVTITPISNNEYIDIVAPIYDDPAFLSILDSAPGPTPITGDQIEIQDPTNEITLAATGVYSVDNGGPGSFQARRWSATTEVWGDWVTITVETVLVLTNESITFAGQPFTNQYPVYIANQAPVVTPPADLPIEYAFGVGGLAQNDSALVAWLASATVADDNDVGLTVSGDVSGLSDPIPAGTHVITFTSTADSGSLVGTATANLIVSEAVQPNQAPVVTPPSNITIQHANNAVGLAKNDPALLAWIATASATDDNDVGLTVSADLSGLADPIPVGIYEITFTSSADSGGLVGTASAFLTVQELAALSPDVVYAPGFKVVKLGGNKHRAKIYNGKNNRIRFELLNNGVSYDDLALTTRAVFTLYHSGSVLTLDSDSIAAAFDWTVGNGYIDINPSALSVVDGTLYEAELVIYNSAHAAGVVFIDRDLLTIEGA